MSDEPAIVSANDSPSYVPPVPMFIPPSLMPVISYMIGSMTILIGSFLSYSVKIHNMTDGQNYEKAFLASLLTWTYPFIASTTAVLIPQNKATWDLLKDSMNKEWYGLFFFNWFSLFYAQYLRENQGLTAFTSSDNIKALSTQLVWNVSQMIFSWKLGNMIDLYEKNFVRSWCDAYESDCMKAQFNREF